MKNIGLLIITILFALSFSACDEDDNFSEPTNKHGGEAYSSQNAMRYAADGIYEDGEMGAGGENYETFEENPFIQTDKENISTFSIDADGAAFANARRFVTQYNSLPQKYSVRTEEFINYFKYNYEAPQGDENIALNGEVCQCPWNTDHKLIRIGIKGKEIAKQDLPPSNLVFLIDVSGSMSSEDKLDMLKSGFKLFVDQISSKDKIAIVTYAGDASVVLESTSGTEKEKIKKAIDKLGSGGGTAGAQGIITAYDIAEANFIEGGNNRIILGTDGDFNIGPSSVDDNIALIETMREKNIFFTSLGVGSGNYNDAMLEQLANNGNGNYEYLDNIEQLKKVFIHEYSKFYTVAKDVKIQIEFNPESVEEYRLIGYENRLLETEDFNDDTKDAGEIGAGQCITALYEIKPKQNFHKALRAFTLDFRYKKPDEDISKKISFHINDSGQSFEQASEDTRFAATAAALGLLFFESEYKGNIDFQKIITWAENAKTYDPYSLKQGFIDMVKRAKEIQ